jgi:murein L,D-transpeptidase YafK
MTAQKVFTTIILILFTPSYLLGAEAHASKSLPQADKILVEKSLRKMTLLCDGHVVRTYKIALGRKPKGHKIKEGDKRTPEGIYWIDSRNPKSRFHLALHISYPNERDIERAKDLNVSPGGGIMIHGMAEGLTWLAPIHYWLNWTQGCIAVTNEEIEEIWQLVPDGTLVEIKP